VDLSFAKTPALTDCVLTWFRHEATVGASAGSASGRVGQRSPGAVPSN